MKKIIPITLMIAFPFLFKGQRDSACKFRISGFQLDMSLLGAASNGGTQEKLQKVVYGNELLNRDLSGYTTGQGGRSANFDGHFSMRVFAELPTQMKHARLEVFAGFRFGSVTLSTTYYYKDNYDTTGVYINPANNAKITTANDYYSGYTYSFVSNQLSLPFGLNISSNKKKRFWFTAGMELCPGINFSSQFEAYHNVSTTGLILNENSQLSNYSSYNRTSYTQGASEFSSKALKGVGFVGYATLPLSINIRLAKKINWLKHFNWTGSIAPGVYVSENKFSGTNNGAILNLATGIRYML